ncbi:MAG: 2-oxoglutarate dehydrogenase, E2 component, dihydrolipoamide succinyltransferase, partial [Actinobacteria bacterium]|nr:2-oxoglutarate dehydrogenase, E2 component, dihydrolipoamide succinyltransferase [Actinomycetota bacterium]
RLAIISAGSAATVATPKPSAPQPAPVSKPQSVAAPVVSAPTVTVTKPAATTPVATVNTFSNSYANVATATTKTSDLYVTPIVRKLANENGVNLASITGTGIGGRIRKEDVLAAIARPTISNLQAQSSQTNVSANGNTARVDNSPRPAIVASPLRGTSVQMSRLRKVIADRMVESLKISAQLTTVVEVDVTKIARLREKAKSSFEAREGVKLSFLPFFAVAVCEALKQHPVLNSSVVGDQINYHNAEHLGIAVDTERGLLVPVIKDAGDLNMGGIARRIADVAARTRDNKISPDDLSGGTFTLTNTGSRGALFDTPIINQPQVAILGLGAVVKRPMVMRGEDGGETIAIRSMVYLALSYDHRVVDGADAARFLVTLKERLEEGRFESDLGL